ncbi:hypothetical protein ADIS_0893 [Lunatimonas lonarensis]|uniref:DUF218 domain-containing protein n=1 Tax=Lunatimonas lonarensis TaxID=1232681 RepID=R7ZX00_9BACT|nr:YdcF family protein [Lunatimonas lonarensis]EON78543.1 hypothetical protein ADIS_0893 [Lunatimonas lonarensis]
MFFAISQLFSFLVMPLTICFLLLLAGQFFPNRVWKRRLQILGLLLLYVFSNGFVANLLINWWEPPYKSIANLPTYEVGIVLTGVTNLSKTAADRTFFDRGADRATHAVQLYKEGKIKKILVSGGQGFAPVNDQREARKLAEFMVIGGVAEDDILIEDQAKNTRENAQLTKDLLLSQNYSINETYLLITSAFHIYRAERCFLKVGINVHTFPVDYYGNDHVIDWKGLIQPSPGSLLIWHKLVKEWLGITIYRIAGYL